MKKLWLLIHVFIFVSATSHAQQPDTLIHKLDSLNIKTDSAGGQKNNINPAAYNATTRITFPGYFILLGSDFKQQLTAPFHLTGNGAIRTGEFAASIAAFTLLDEPVQRTALKTRNSNTVRSVSKYITNSGGIFEAYTLSALGAYGFAFKNVKMQTTTLLATQAYLTSGTMEGIIKFIAGRQRPNYYDPSKADAEPTFHGPLFKPSNTINGNHLSTSFPSGHTTVAFAAATVFAMEYKHTPWVPIVSYSAASLIGISRLTENKHWATDVIAGAALGYLCGRQVVNNYHRYAKIKSGKPKNTVYFNMGYSNGTLMPGLTYNFR
ncbi:MAG: phosphatase PAP2 family protein [Ginsengibacter sp.]